MRRPHPATVIAVLALVVAAAPVADAATGWVKRALYARNAGAVDGLSASRVPQKGKLVMLPRSGKLPASILPASAGGPAGPAGAAGDAVAVASAATAAAVAIGAGQTGVVTLPLKAGSYAILAKASLHTTTEVSAPAVLCQLKAGADGDQVEADLSSSSDAPVALVTVHTFPSAGTATLTCAADDAGVVTTDARIVALRASS